MEWTQILIALSTFVSGGGIAALVTLRSKKVIGKADADIAQINALERALKIVDNKDAIIEGLNGKIEQLQEELAKKRDENTTKGYYMCVHLGCPLRRPGLGRGKVYFKDHEGEENFGADYNSIDTLYSEYKRKLPEWATRDSNGRSTAAE